MTNDDNLSALYRGFQSEKLSLSNRVVMAPMTRTMSPNQIPDVNVADYYARRAKENVGFILTEGTLIDDPSSASIKGIPFFHGASLSGWKKVVEKVHKQNGKIASQIWHPGVAREDFKAMGMDMLPFDSPSICPSGIDRAGNKFGNPMSLERIDYVINAYAKAANDAKQLGFDAVEIHGAHGYLIDQFLWERTNQRKDEFGGDFRRRLRFATEVVKACRAAVGEAFPILFRFSQWKDSDYSARIVDTPKELEQFLGVLVEAGVDIFDCSTRRYWEPEFEGSDKTLATWTRELSGKPSIAVGSVGLGREYDLADIMTVPTKYKPISDMLERLERDDFDLIAVGRSLLADPFWSTKIKEGREPELTGFSPEALTALN